MSIKIIIIDDEPDVLTFVQAALEDHGYEVVTAHNARKGLETIKREKPALICLDVLMPRESGISLFKKLRSDPGLKEIPIVILSGLSLSRDLDHVDYLKLDDGTVLEEPEGYIEKPVDVARLLSVIEKVLG